MINSVAATAAAAAAVSGVGSFVVGSGDAHWQLARENINTGWQVGWPVGWLAGHTLIVDWLEW